MAVSDTARRTLAAVLGLNQRATALPVARRRRDYPLGRRCVAAILGVPLPDAGYNAKEADLGGSNWAYVLAPAPRAPRLAGLGVVSGLLTGLVTALIVAAATFATLNTGSSTTPPVPSSTDPVELPGRSHCSYSSDRSHTIVKGMRGKEVKQVQCLLHFNYSHSASVNITGTFDSNTENAVKVVQQCNGIASDGAVGPKTWQVLEHPPSRDTEMPGGDPCAVVPPPRTSG
jgi:peptidoglycan hydrolase-like protein with peptidoglycan-binding domain